MILPVSRKDLLFIYGSRNRIQRLYRKIQNRMEIYILKPNKKYWCVIVVSSFLLRSDLWWTAHKRKNHGPRRDSLGQALTKQSAVGFSWYWIHVTRFLQEQFYKNNEAFYQLFIKYWFPHNPSVCSDEGLTLETSAKYHIPQATNIPYVFIVSLVLSATNSTSENQAVN